MNKFIKTAVVLVILFATSSSIAQISNYFIPKTEPGYMGLASGSLNFGYQGYRNHETFPGDIYMTDRKNGPFATFSINTSFLSNYYWSSKSDKKIKFGMVEKVEIGVGNLKNTTRTNSPYALVKEDHRKFIMPLIIEVGVGLVYKINDKTDIGTNYYFLTVSSFHENTTADMGYFKFRGRYHRYMAEISAFGRKVIDLKYLTNGNEDKSYTKFVGITYTGWSEEGPGVGYGYVNQRASQFFFSVGTIF